MNNYLQCFLESINSFAFEFPQEPFQTKIKSEIFSKLPNEIFSEFYQISNELCVLESSTFLTDENKIHLQDLHNKWNRVIQQLNPCLALENISLSPLQWRLFSGLYCCFIEWCHDVRFYQLKLNEQEFVWTENPLNSF